MVIVTNDLWRTAKEVRVTANQKPGETAKQSGQYVQVGPRGGITGVERTVTRGEPLPPTPRPGMTYMLVDRTKTKGR